MQALCMGKQGKSTKVEIAESAYTRNALKTIYKRRQNYAQKNNLAIFENEKV